MRFFVVILCIYQQTFSKEFYILYKGMFIKQKKQQTQIGYILQRSNLFISQAVMMMAVALFCASYCVHFSQTKYFLIKTAPAGTINDYCDEQKVYQESERLTVGGNIKE